MSETDRDIAGSCTLQPDRPKESSAPPVASLGIATLFEQVTRETPDAIALVQGNRRLAYRELNDRADTWADFLRGRGVGRGSVVAIQAGRSVELVVGILGILKAGAAYLPVDAFYPVARVDLMLRDSGAKLMLTSSHLRGTASPDVVPHYDLDRDPPATVNPPLRPGSPGGGNDPACLIYTSGSTGRPHGVVVPHRGIVNLVRGQTYVRFGRSDRFLLQSSPAFDAMSFELWGPLLNGGTCVVFPHSRLDLELFEDVIRREGVTCLFLTTGLFNQIVDLRPTALSGVREVMTGGEKMSAAHTRRAITRYPHIRWTNAYGPTECTTFACTHRIAPPEEWSTDSIPIGRPLNRFEAYIVNEQDQPVAADETGELLLGGPSVALGYRNEPELTARKFVRHPESNDPSARLYHTGDRCRWLPDGTIEFIDRADSQIKLRGFRIELSEIENELRSLNGISDAAVAVRETAQGSSRIVAGVVAIANHPPDLDAWQAALGRQLPDYMVPADWHALSQLPLTINGKVDRPALAAMSSNPSSTVTATDAPGQSPDPAILEAWRRVSRNPNLGWDDDFFQHGGDSLMCLELADECHRLLGQRVPARLIYAAPTPREFAELLAQNPDALPGPELLGSGPESPLFWFPGIFGIQRMPAEFVPMLENRRPYYDLLTYPGTDDGVQPTACIEAVAAACADQVERVAPIGPVCVAGYSFGGQVAYETARVLSARGRQVDAVILFDAETVHMFRFRSFLGRMTARIQYVRRTSWRERRDLFSDFLSRLLARFRPGPDQCSRAATRPAETGRPTANPMFVQTSLHYTPGAYAGRVLLIRCAQPECSPIDAIYLKLKPLPDHGWGPLAGPGLTVRNLDCKHSDFITQTDIRRQFMTEALALLDDVPPRCDHASNARESLSASAVT